jgi:3-oxoadipate enol-lactonase
MRCLGNNILTTVNNLTVSYNDEGPEEAPVIIFIHGFPFNMCMWEKQVNALKDNYRVIAYDVRGHGKSEAGSGAFSIELFASDLMGLMDKLELDKAIVCGLSMGGYIALNAIQKHPDRFDALVLCDTQCTADTPEGKEKRMKTIESIKENGVEGYANESINHLFAPETYTNKQKEIAAVREMIVNTSIESLCKTLDALASRNETCGKLQDIKAPVLIMVGNEDRITPPAVSRLMDAKIENSAMFTIVHAGHVSSMENPEAFNEQLKKFLQKVTKKYFHLNSNLSVES